MGEVHSAGLGTGKLFENRHLTPPFAKRTVYLEDQMTEGEFAVLLDIPGRHSETVRRFHLYRYSMSNIKGESKSRTHSVSQNLTLTQ